VNRMCVYIEPSSDAFFLTNLCFLLMFVMVKHVRKETKCRPTGKVIGLYSFYMCKSDIVYFMKR
jgi:hypothetical protein